MRRTPVRAVAFALVLLLAAQTALAHIDNPPPRLQPFQTARTPDVTLNGTRANFDLLLASDPLRHLVRHTVDPAAGLFVSEYRFAPPDAAGAFRLVVEIERLIEYRDVNEDLRYDPLVDVLVRSWRLDAGTWRAGNVQDALYGRASAKTVEWRGNLSAGPSLTVLAAAAGAAVLDEGARALPQDILLYVDIENFPPRGTGHVYALDGTVRTSPIIGAHEDVAAVNVTTSISMREERNMAFLQWGGEAVLDGRESVIEATLGPLVDGEQSFRIHFPVIDRSVRLVMVAGVEYVVEPRGTDAPAAPWALLALVAVSLAWRRDRRAPA